MCWCWRQTEGLHHLVGNAVTKDKYIVVGNGSSQLFQAALFAVSPSVQMSLITPSMLLLLLLITRSTKMQLMYCIQGCFNGLVMLLSEGKLIHDLAYYWPQYTPITYEADHDVMLFTFSKCTGHAGSRIGWAIVKDIEVAKKMVTFVQSSSMGVSKESQTRAAKIIAVICDGYQNFKSNESELFFEYSKRLMRERWEKFRGAVEQSMVFTVTKYPRAYCNFTNEISETYPSFAWLKCEDGVENSHNCLRKLNICAREGERFGADSKYVRVSMLCMDDEFNEMVKRLSNAKKE
ncbi:tryptophan aminotransferase-related protein [Trifolium repens]|nr:tryptophan aminotransferase-related protein [Trifolium repens]